MEHDVGKDERRAKKGLSGHITILAALSFTLMVTLICTCFKSALAVNRITETDMASRLAVESAFAGYSTGLFEEFDIFALKKDDFADNILKYYCKRNIEGISGKGAVSYINAEFETKSAMTGLGGKGVKQQILSYMKNGIVSDLLSRFMDIDKESKKSETINNITDQVIACEERIEKIDKLILETIELVEGIETKDGMITVRNGKAVATGEYYAKAIITSPLNRETACIDSDAVYQALSQRTTRYVNICEIMDNMYEYAMAYDDCARPNDGETDMATAALCENGYRDNYNLMVNAVETVIKKSEQAISKLSEYKVGLDGVRDEFKKCEKMATDNRDILGEEVSSTLAADIKDMQKTNQYLGEQMCNATFMKIGLEHNLTLLKNGLTAIKRLDVSLKEYDSERISGMVTDCKAMFKGLSNNLLKFNYSNIDFSSSGSGIKVIEALKNTLSDGIGGLVLGERKVSDKSVSYTNLASSHMSVSESADKQNVSQILTDTALIDEYILERFPDATAEASDDESDWCGLDYAVEYVLCGNNNDRDNLNEVLLMMTAIRESANLTFLIVDKEKRNEALTLATSLVGYTGNTVIVKVAQYLILAVWALGESICDLRKLLNGDTVPLVKGKKDWNLTLANLLAMKFDVEKSGETGNGSSGDKGSLTDMCYQDYLRILLAAMDDTKRCFRIMDVMELRMIALGDAQFRMDDYMWSGTGVVTLQMENSDEYYIREINYSYL